MTPNAAIRLITASVLLATIALAAPPEISKPVWLVPPSDAKPFAHLPNVEARRSNNNLSIAHFDGRLYFAFRSATHHHPKPPVWVWEKPGYEKWQDAKTRLYVLSAAATKADLREWETTAPKLKWRFELETNALTQNKNEDDFREPLFLVLNGKLHFYFGQVLGQPMQAKVLGLWHTALGNEGKWEAPKVLSKNGEMHWDVAVRTEGKSDVAYMTSYVGNAYDTTGKDPNFRVYLRKSTDGVEWKHAGARGYTTQGGVSEAAIAFLPKSGELWSMLRLEDGDQRGWGSLVGVADEKALEDWDLPKSADPRRYDSPRLFVENDELYLVARQNIVPEKNGTLDEATNAPFDHAYRGRSAEEGEKARQANLEKIKAGKASFNAMTPWNLGLSVQYAKAYHFDEVKRTALYRIDLKTREPKMVIQLPSAGDTAFASIIPLGEGDYLIANYSSPFQEKKFTWNDGQNNPTGIYAVRVRFR